ncbi:MAG TPA: hypothetical protein PKI03_02460 [Pseudomonadota bacterium]|nr:hypothetical protein [Pseudomonadota bacterium]
MQLIAWLGISRQKFSDWRRGCGKIDEHNAWIPRDHWLLPKEEQTLVAFHDQHPLEGHRRLTFMMIDQDLVGCTPSSVYCMLSVAGGLESFRQKAQKRGTWVRAAAATARVLNVDIAHPNLCSTFYCMCSTLDGASGAILHFELREAR